MPISNLLGLCEEGRTVLAGYTVTQHVNVVWLCIGHAMVEISKHCVHRTYNVHVPVYVVAYKCATVIRLPLDVERTQCQVELLNKGSITPTY